jgi:hypothetical protein
MYTMRVSLGEIKSYLMGKMDSKRFVSWAEMIEECLEKFTIFACWENK